MCVTTMMMMTTAMTSDSGRGGVRARTQQECTHSRTVYHMYTVHLARTVHTEFNQKLKTEKIKMVLRKGTANPSNFFSLSLDSISLSHQHQHLFSACFASSVMCVQREQQKREEQEREIERSVMNCWQ